MKKREHAKSFFSGVVTALLLAGCLTTALAASGKVSYNFSNVSLDGERKITAGADITAANGQKVPSSILFTDEAGGKTNYLPIRAISDLLGVEIGYDSATKTVLLGKQPAANTPASDQKSWAADGWNVTVTGKDGNKEKIPTYSDLYPGQDLPDGDRIFD